MFVPHTYQYIYEAQKIIDDMGKKLNIYYCITLGRWAILKIPVLFDGEKSFLKTNF
jgi:hypothetical protein